MKSLEHHHGPRKSSSSPRSPSEPIGERLDGDGEQILVRFERGDAHEVRVALSEFRGRQYLNVRLFFRGEDGGWHPTRKGSNLRIDELPALADAVARAMHLATER
jgi:hypothetical protein